MDSRRKWIIAAMLFIGGGVSYLDRAARSVLAPLVVRDLKLDPASLGLVFSAFFVGYALCCMAGGMAADRFGPRKVIVCTILAWSLFCGLTGVAISFASLLVIRLFFGMAEGPFLSTSSKIVCNWFYVSANCYFAIILDMVESSRVGALGGFIHMIANFAGVLAPVITGFIVQATGSFTSAFLLAGGVALAGFVSVAVLVSPGPKARESYVTARPART